MINDNNVYLDAEVTSDGARSGVSGVGGSQHDSASLDSVETFPDHGKHGATKVNKDRLEKC